MVDGGWIDRVAITMGRQGTGEVCGLARRVRGAMVGPGEVVGEKRCNQKRKLRSLWKAWPERAGRR